ncbi:MAG: 2-phospho-L-lactate guanylyltransferase [Pseudonocardiaceae bacterium]|nr:2-phospho-L-lactate guanylyltransferase [Pseudonocardiaceae bacterium]
MGGQDGRVHPTVDLLVPIKPLAQAKTRLRGAADGGAGDRQAHARLVLALARDVLAAAAAAATIGRLLAITSDRDVAVALATDGVATLPDEPDAGLNPALRHGERALRAASPGNAVAVLQADLAALRPEELDTAVGLALATAPRAFCSDRAGTGTTLLVAGPGQPLDPRFGAGSAAAHRLAGAVELAGDWPGLRCDVDTPADLATAVELGLGKRTRTVLAARTGCTCRPDVCR